MSDIAARLASVRASIAAAAAAAGRKPADIRLIAVSKTHDAAAVREAFAAGQTAFGENRVQEARAKFAEMPERHRIELHLIGPLQTNKAHDAVALFDVIHTVDRPRLAEALAAAMAKAGKRPACFVEVNTGEEPQKAGVLPQEADAFIAACRAQWRLPVAGVMGIPPVDEPAAPHFALLRAIAGRNGLASISMGMSADYETAIRLGATHVRIGTAIFGPRAGARGPGTRVQEPGPRAESDP